MMMKRVYASIPLFEKEKEELSYLVVNSLHTLITLDSRLASHGMKSNVPSGFTLLISSTTLAPCSFDLPMEREKGKLRECMGIPNGLIKQTQE
jgi:hypothetical protein